MSQGNPVMRQSTYRQALRASDGSRPSPARDTAWAMSEQTMMLAAITFSEVMVTVHILAVVVAFGGALAYPIWFRMIRNGTPEQRASTGRRTGWASS